MPKSYSSSSEEDSSSSGSSSSNNSSHSSSNESSSEESVESSSLGGSEWDSDSDDMEFDSVKDSIVHSFQKIFGTPESRYAKRTHPAYAWKQNLEYESAKKAYLKEVDDEKKEVQRRIEIEQAKYETEAIRKNQRLSNKKERERFQNALERRKDRYKRELEQLDFFSNMMLENIERDQRLAQEATAQDLIDKAKLRDSQFDEAEKKKEEDLRAANALEKFLYDDASRISKQFGLLPATKVKNTTKKSKSQDEASVTVVLRLLPNIHEINKLPKTKRNYFNVKLKRYKHCEVLKCEKLGEKGGNELGKALRTGACLHLKHLDLSWNRIKYRGVHALSTAFTHGACMNLSNLDLRVNGIDSKALGELLQAIEKGGVPALSSLNLEGNDIGDDGAKSVAHSVFKGTLKTLVALNLRQNKIKDTGGNSLWSSFNAESMKRLCPKLTSVDFSRNNISPAQSAKFNPCPLYMNF